MVKVEIEKTTKTIHKATLNGDGVNFAELIRKFKSEDSLDNFIGNAYDFNADVEVIETKIKIKNHEKEIWLKDILE